MILVIALLVVGPAKLPELSRSLGRAIREFRRVQGEAQEQLRSVIDLDGDNKPVSLDTESATKADVPLAPPLDLGPPEPPPNLSPGG